MKLYDLIHQSAASAVPLIYPVTGSMPPGHNGPYHDPETPVRNTSHWLITLLKAQRISGEKQFLEAARQAATYLCSDAARPMGATFWHRRNPEKDACNGLIGQAWTIEALAVAAEPLEMPELARLAEDVFLLHPLDESAGLWRRVEVDGAHLSFDMTFNHQLWFAATGGLLARNSPEVNRRVSCFMDHLAYHLDIAPSGLIYHPLARRPPWQRQVRHWLGRLRQSAQAHREMAYRAVGYHAFNLYAFALLKQQYPDHPFWKSAKFQIAWRYANTETFAAELGDNKYGYPYNPAGFEMAFALEVFDAEQRPEQGKWLAEQFRRCYNFESHLMERGTEDPATHAARLYEATRLPNLTVQVGT